MLPALYMNSNYKLFNVSMATLEAIQVSQRRVYIYNGNDKIDDYFRFALAP